MQALIKQLLVNGPVVTDGAWGTALQARGLAIGEFPDAWNLSRPERVVEVARAYVEAGSQIILTNTFGANRVRLAVAGLEGKVVDINRAGVEISRRAAFDRAFVFGSMGPGGELLRRGNVDREELRAAFVEQARALAAAGADGLVIETMSDLEEAVLAVAAARTTGLPVVGCMVFDWGGDRALTGHSPAEAAQALAAAGADVIGANCGRGIAGFAAICKELRAATDRPVWIKPNAGMPELIGGRATYRTTPEEFCGAVAEWIEAGASFVGGCCGTGPDFIRALKERIGSLGTFANTRKQ